MKKENIKVIFGRNLKKYRAKMELSQAALSEKLNISNKHLSKIEVGHQFPSSVLLQKIVDTLQISPSSLFQSEEYIIENNISLKQVYEIIDDGIEKYLKDVKSKLFEEIK
ncbi:MAG: helix-turn-helix transcriptional regulator [Ignavibacteriales bacterium]|nr:helix-turn-helix transcriptional regulator [Ignavibacteriales bacterium]